MSTSTKSSISSAARTWPKRALGVFALLVVLVYALVFFTGDKSATPKLGIDLSGGTRVTLVPQGAEPTAEQLAQARQILERRVNGMGVSGAEVVTNGTTLVITVPGEDTTQAQQVGQTSQLLFRPVAQQPFPDTAEFEDVLHEMAQRWVDYGLIEAAAANDSLKQVHEALAEQEAATGDKPLTVRETTVAQPDNSVAAAQRLRDMTQMLLADRQSEDPTVLAAAATLMTCQGDTDPLAGTDDPALPLLTCDYATGAPYMLDPAPLLSGVSDPEGTRLTGNEIDTDSPISGGLNPQTGQMEISFSFRTGDGPNGSQTWADLTAEYLQRQIAITLDSAVISAPVIQGQTPYGSATSITGQFTQAEAQSLANNLRYGALPLSFTGEDGESGGTSETVPPSLGAAALQAGLIAGIVGFILVALYALYYFRALGFISLVTLIASGVLTYGALVLLGRWIGYSLDLSGIAGLVIGVGATADSFVVYYERIKDELLEGRTFRSAAVRAWERARATIITGNAVTLIGAVVVYFLAVGEVKGFAFTLGLTTVFDLVVSFLVMAPLMQLAARRPAFARPELNGLGGIFALVEERREAGYYSAAQQHAQAAETAAGQRAASANSASADTTAQLSAPSALLLAVDDHNRDTDPDNQEARNN